MFPDFPPFWNVFAIVGNILLLAHVAYHWRKRPPVAFEMPPKEAILHEEYAASGNSLRDLLTRFGGARNCLHLVVTADALYIRPVFPFSIFGTLLDLSHHVPRWRLVSLRETKSLLYDGYEIEYKHNSGETTRFYFRSHGEESLRRALLKAGFLSPSPEALPAAS
ncbi:MAG: hypothetical protein H7Y38_03455 [Armatimonadetes bacterium]|nr:hypothetical protein [Armatimonadota bacterium]